MKKTYFFFKKHDKKIINLLLKNRTPLSSAMIAKKLKIPRQTIYSALLSLLSRGLIVATDHFNTKVFTTNKTVLHNYVSELENEVMSFKEVESSSQINANDQGKNLPKIQFVKHIYGVKRFFDSILRYYKSGAEKIFRGYGVNYFAETKIDADIRKFVKERFKLGVKTYLFIGKGPDDFGINHPTLRYGREIKHLNMEPQGAAVYVIDNRVYIFSYVDEIGVMVENKEISKLFTNIFEAQWKDVIK